MTKISGAAADGYSKPYVWAVCMGSTLYAILGLVMLTGLAVRRFSSFTGMVGVLAVWLGSPLIFYMYLHPSMSHACSFFLCVLLLWEYERWRGRGAWWNFLLMGLTSGLIVTTRFSDGMLLLIPAAFWIECVREKNASRFPRAVIGSAALAAGVLLAMIPQFAAWHALHGSWFSGPREYGLSTNLSPIWKSPHLFDVLFSGWRGLFVWSPVLLVGGVGYALLLGRKGDSNQRQSADTSARSKSIYLLDYALALATIAQLWVIGGWAVWWGGASFGQRFFINLLPVFAFGLTYLLYRTFPPSHPTKGEGRKRVGVMRGALIGIIILCLLWSGGLMVQYVSGMMSREEPVTLKQLTGNQWRRVPVWVWDHARLLLPSGRLRTGTEAK